jgi:hypothetical protein
MYFGFFYAEFPKIAAAQTRIITILDDKHELPKGEYGFLVSYCNDKKCDCRRAMISVVRPEQKPGEQPLATLSYGWEPRAFYLKWSPSMKKEELDWFRGPAVEPFQPQSQYSEELLFQFRILLQDPVYARRFVRHYALFKWKKGMKLHKDLLPWLGLMNDCPCGSGEKLKFCCAGKGG